MGEMEAVVVRRSARETTAELLGAAGARRLRCGRRRRPGKVKMGAGWLGQALALLMARVGLPWPRWAGRW